jgi:hypothetical protein
MPAADTVGVPHSTCAYVIETGKLTTVVKVRRQLCTHGNIHDRLTSLSFCLGVCEFAPAFVDTPKGDLDSSDSVDGPDEILVENSATFPYGTSEQFPPTVNSDLQPVHQMAHDYAECSNAGLCNRTTGVCDCFHGFTGGACQRMTCPGSEEGELECSGHGSCHTLRRIADLDYHGTYDLWDKNLLVGCVCDKGYFGADCSQRACPYGLDPLYLDDVGTIQIPSYFLTVLTTSDYFDFTDGFAQPSAGTYRLKLYDKHGQGYLTSPIRAGATCADIVAAMENAPGGMIPRGQTNCLEVQFTDQDPLSSNSSWKIKYDSLYQYYFDGTKSYQISSRPAIDAFGYENSVARNKSTDALLSGNLYFFQFFGNVGDFQQPEINTHMFDGMSSSLQSQNGQVVARVWTNGMQGNNIDYFADRCEGVKAQVKQSDGEGFLWGKYLSDEFLATCLGGGQDVNRGTMYNPHLIKLVRTQTDPRDGYFMAAVYFDTNTDFVAGAGERKGDGTLSHGAWRLLNPLYSLDNDEAIYDVFASHGTLTVTDNRAGAAFSFGSNVIHTYNTSFDQGFTTYDGDISCDLHFTPAGETNDGRACLDKGDLFVLINPYNGADNPPFLNLYRAQSIRRMQAKVIGDSAKLIENYNPATDVRVNLTSQYVVTADMNVNWASTQVGPSVFHVYKFVPNMTNAYHYVSQCSNRGLCNHFEGTCECFGGYSGAACSDQSTVIT